MTPPILAEGLTHRFGEGPHARRVLDGLDLTVAAGTFVLVTGPSGSGKTTLLTILGGLRTPTAGRVEILGVPVGTARRAEIARLRRRIGFVFQRHNLLRPLTVVENVEAGLHAADADGNGRGGNGGIRARALAMLEAVGLAAHAHAMPDRLSGGEQQRVAVARALVRRPALVIADEPTASLDHAAGRLVVDRMKSLSAQVGCSVVMTTHDDRLYAFADRRIHLEDGRIVPLATHAGAQT
ncbi:putative ABC transport system ATP-binding protein [Constrictibacter sp. MBR-5]|jgi:putative ABC transport system ATP-binding protein|uniref:ABC transporter ATP-binding protein n=1 Tax=Constrictibacter sp. MBR-5 TaxID=3156467 RepID=UPI003393670A